jgi:hypothetical protein
MHCVDEKKKMGDYRKRINDEECTRNVLLVHVSV